MTQPQFFQQRGQSGGNEYARQIGEYGEQVVQSLRKPALHQPQCEKHEVSRLRVAEHAAVQ